MKPIVEFLLKVNIEVIGDYNECIHISKDANVYEIEQFLCIN